jgi:hypothetical protein
MISRADPAAVDRLRADLVKMRDGLIDRLARKIDGDDLALLGTVGSALVALDQAIAAAAPVTIEARRRACPIGGARRRLKRAPASEPPNSAFLQ